jgi:hypothetical protein
MLGKGELGAFGESAVLKKCLSLTGRSRADHRVKAAKAIPEAIENLPAARVVALNSGYLCPEFYLKTLSEACL